MLEYTHGGDIYRRQIEYDFSVNINPLGMPERSLSAACEGVHKAGSYPDYRGEKLCLAIGEAQDVPSGQVLLGNGAAELIYALCQALRPRKALCIAPTFSEYEAAVKSAGGETEYFVLEERGEFALSGETGDKLLKRITPETNIFFFCNPNNPTGFLTDRNMLLAFAKRCEETGTWFCVDECFLPFVREEAEYTMKRFLAQFPHMLVLGAFTKIYAMPGLRLGYVLCANEQLLKSMRLVLQPWNTSVPAQLAGAAALEDREYLERTYLLMERERAYLLEELQKGIAEKIYPPSANFIFFRSRRNLKEGLEQEKILIRDCSDFPALTGGQGYFRIGIRTHEENEELVRRARKVLGGVVYG